MPDAVTLTDTDFGTAEAIWADYRRRHDTSHRDGQAVGIDPHTAEVFFGDSALAISRMLESEGRFRQLYVTRVGRPAYGRLPWGRLA